MQEEFSVCAINTKQLKNHGMKFIHVVPVTKARAT